MNTPKAFANFSPGVGAQRQPWDQNINSDRTLKGFATRLTLSGFGPDLKMLSQGSRDARTAGLKLANAFGVNSNCVTTVCKDCGTTGNPGPGKCSPISQATLNSGLWCS